MIDARDFDARFATVAEVLGQVPGVRVRRFGGLGSASTASIRGSKSEQVLVVVDGVRLNSAQRGSVDLSTIPLRQVERIEVLRGGGSARYGSDAEGGVISITTRKPESAETNADASLSAGTLGTLGGDLELSGGGERARALGTYSRLRSDNEYRFVIEPPDFVGPGLPGTPPPSTQTHRRLNADFVENAGLLRGTLSTGPRSQLDAMLDLYEKDGGEPGGTWSKPFYAEDDVVSCTTSDESYERGLLRLGFRHERALGGAFELAGAFRAEEDRLDDPSGGCGFIDPLVTGGRDSAHARESESSLEARWVATPREYLGWLELGGRAASSLRYARVDASESDVHRRTTVLVSLAPELSLLGGELRVFPALAFERADTSNGLARSAASQPPREVSPSDENAWLPSIGAIWEIAPGLRAKGNWKRIARRPTFSDLFHPDWTFIRGNPELVSERGWNADLGFELASPGAGPVTDLLLQADVFQREIDEGIEWMLNVNNSYMPVNTGPSRALGFELGLGARLFERVQLGASYTYTDARYLGGGSGAAYESDSDLRLPHVPEDMFALNASLDLGPVQPWTELRYESEVSYQVGNARLSEAGYQVDAGVILRPGLVPGLGFFGPSVTLSVEAANLNHEQRSDSLGQPLPNQTLWLVRLRGATP